MIHPFGFSRYPQQVPLRVFDQLIVDVNPDGDEVRDDDAEREGSEGDGEGGDDDGGQGKQEYVKKEFYSRQYVSPFGNETENSVRGYIVKHSR